MTDPFHHTDPVRCAKAIIDRVGRQIVLATPIGIGKPNLLINALYDLAEADRSLRLKIFTGLTLVRPAYTSSLERRFLEPLLDRLFASWPDLRYVAAIRKGALPANIEVHEFFLQAGAWLKFAHAQRSYVSMDYTHVAAHLERLGTNVFAQMVAPDPAGGSERVSLSSNPDVTLDMLPYIAARRRANEPVAVAGQINANLPYMPGEAEVARADFDVMLEPERPHYDLFAPPKEPVALADYAMALHVAPLVKDGGTLQIGIGSFADALAHVLVLRHTRNQEFRALLGALGTPLDASSDLAPFNTGLYGCSEMLVDGFLKLREAGILRRSVPIASAGASSRSALLHAGFFVGNTAFYRALREMPRRELDEICMTAISFTNALLGEEQTKRAQRRDARFINSAMTATLLGAVSSDQLDDGRVISGVGGQHDFVSMAHALADARSIIAVRSTRGHAGKASSNIVWQYANATVPRHLRDIVVTEYGVADTRGASDRDVIAAMLSVADSQFQTQLRDAAIGAGKLERSFSLPTWARNNRPERLKAALGEARASGLLPQFPFGTEMTDVEQALLEPLAYLKGASKLALAQAAAAGLMRGKTSPQEATRLHRLGLDTPTKMEDRILRAVVLGAIRRAHH